MVDDLLPRLRSDELLSRFWVSPRSVDTHNRERQLLLILSPQRREDRRFTGQGHEGFPQRDGITKADYVAFMRCLDVSLDTFEVSEPERSEVVGSVTSLEPEIVEA